LTTIIPQIGKRRYELIRLAPNYLCPPSLILTEGNQLMKTNLGSYFRAQRIDRGLSLWLKGHKRTFLWSFGESEDQS
jgi:hypothetical protein